MLLRRFLTHFRAQDWIAICLDFVIVVVGIFVGLQVDSWNQDRKERIRERVSLEQLYSDFSLAHEQAQEMAEFHAGKDEDLGFVIDTMLSETLAPDDRRRMIMSLLSMAQLPPLGVSLGTYDSMIASGDIALIQDAELKSMLVRLEASLESENNLLGYFRLMNQSEQGFSQRHFRLVPNSDSSDVTFDFDFDRLLRDPEAFSVIASQQRNHRVFHGFRQDIADSLAEARTHIGNLIGTQKTATE